MAAGPVPDGLLASAWLLRRCSRSGPPIPRALARPPMAGRGGADFRNIRWRPAASPGWLYRAGLERGRGVAHLRRRRARKTARFLRHDFVIFTPPLVVVTLIVGPPCPTSKDISLVKRP